MQWKIGDKCYCVFQLSEVCKIESDGRIRDIKQGPGHISTWDWTEKIFPADADIKAISDRYYKVYEDLHGIKFGDLNYPDIVDHLEKQWIIACNNKNNKDVINRRFEDLEHFYNQILTHVNQMKRLSVDGIRIIRQ